MRYRLRTLMLAATLGPPVLALLWFGAIWARFTLPALLDLFLRYLMLPGMAGLVVLVAYSSVPPPPGNERVIALGPWQTLLLWTGQFLAQWHWIWLSFLVGGWSFIWGDRGPPFSDAAIAATAAALSALFATLTSLRIVRRQATVTYAVVVACLVSPLLSIAVLTWLARWLR